MKVARPTRGAIVTICVVSVPPRICCYIGNETMWWLSTRLYHPINLLINYLIKVLGAPNCFLASVQVFKTKAMASSSENGLTCFPYKTWVTTGQHYSTAAGEEFVEMKHGQPYAIGVENKSDYRCDVNINIDGQNMGKVLKKLFSSFLNMYCI